MTFPSISFAKWKTVSWQGWTLAVVILLGAYLRIWQLGGVDFLHDEAWVLKYLLGQDAPIETSPPLFLFASRLSLWLIGPGTFAMRLLPAIIGTLGIPLQYLLVRRMDLSRTAALIAAMLWAFNPAAITFARFFHHYSIECTTVIAVLLLTEIHMHRRDDKSFLCLLLFCLASFTWTQTTIFLMPSVVVCLWFLWRSTRQSEDVLRLWFFNVLVLGTYLAYYLLFVSKMIQPGGFLYNGKWLPFFLSPTPLSALPGTIALRLVSILNYLLGWWPAWSTAIVGFLFLIGAAILLKRNLRYTIAYVCTPVCVMVFFALIRKYPLGERADLFLLSIVLVCVAVAIDWLAHWRRSLEIGAALALLVITFLSANAQMPIPPKFKQAPDIQNPLEYFQEHRSPDDFLTLLFDRGAVPQFNTYLGEDIPVSRCSLPNYTLADNASKIACIGTEFSDKRVWWLWVGHASSTPKPADSANVIEQLQSHCNVLDMQAFDVSFLALTDHCTPAPDPQESQETTSASSKKKGEKSRDQSSGKNP